MEKLTCLNCPVTCCNDLSVKVNRHRKGKPLSKIKDPKTFKTGSIVEIAGLTLIKKENGFWKCKAFDEETRKCMVYDYRPYLCRVFTCHYYHSKRNKIYHVKNKKNYCELQDYTDYVIGLKNTYEAIEKKYYS